MTAAPTPEFSRPADRRHLKAGPVRLEANEAERSALAQRFGIVAVGRLVASIDCVADGEVVNASGTIEADIVQLCAISGDELPQSIREEITLRFVPEREITDEEIELEEDDLDETPYSGTSFDLGEAVAQSLALAIDPYATGPDAQHVREEHGLAEKTADGPLQDALAKALGKS